MIKVITDFPIAYDSPDHISPTCTINDNGGSNMNFVLDIENYFGRKVSVMDLGCAGGQSVVDFHNNGNFAIGLEGSDASIHVGAHNWPIYNNKILFTCDITRPFRITNDDNPMLFDVITSWEVLEHLSLNEISRCLMNVRNNLKDDGLFIGSVGLKTNFNHALGQELHRTLIVPQEWDAIFSLYFDTIKFPFPYNHAVRYPANIHDPSSYSFAMKKIV